MTEEHHKSTAFLRLDPDEVLAVRENLEASIRIGDGPPGRRVPETLCAEIGNLLRLIEVEMRRQAKPLSER